MSPSAWIAERRYRLLDLVRHQWGEESAEQLRYAIDDYLRTAPENAELVLQVRALSARLRELDPPPPVCRDYGVRFTGD
jgi:hypothetical protein